MTEEKRIAPVENGKDDRVSEYLKTPEGRAVLEELEKGPNETLFSRTLAYFLVHDIRR